MARIKGRFNCTCGQWLPTQKGIKRIGLDEFETVCTVCGKKSRHNVNDGRFNGERTNKRCKHESRNRN